MFDISFSEILIILLAAIVFIGPKDLPKVIRALARGIAWLKKLGRDMRDLFDELAKEVGYEEVKSEIERETKFIRGDDGKMYESYDLSLLPSRTQKGQEGDASESALEKKDPPHA